MSHLDDDGSLSGEFLAVEEADSHGHRQSLWVRVAPVFYGSEEADAPTIQVCYQKEHGVSGMEGPVFLDPSTWRALNRAVEQRLRRYEPWWRRRGYLR